jgi:hypothetical protein
VIIVGFYKIKGFEMAHWLGTRGQSLGEALDLEID